LPLSYELIVCNPPWINAKPVKEDEFEIGNFDQDEQMIRALFKFCSSRLQTKSPNQKNGSLLLVYSDLSTNMGLSQKHIVDELCMQHGLRIVGKHVV
jgi:methylase of polypeptide subunit release factors